MKKIISFILSFTLLFTSIPSLAALGDYIHVGAEKGYSIQSDEDKRELLNDLKKLDIKGFYRQVTEDGKFINIVDEQIAEEEVLLELLKSDNVDLTVPSAIENYIENNREKVSKAIKEAIDKIEKDFDAIEKEGDKKLDEYFEGAYADELKEGVNYSKPSRGYVENSTKLTNPVFPSGSNASSWMIATGDKKFGPFRKDSVLNVSNARRYNFGTDIIMPANERHLLLVAVGPGNTIKAYASIGIEEDMILPPKQVVNRDESIGISLAKGENYSGSTKVTVNTEGNWNIAVLDTMPETIYTSSTFNSSKYEAGMEIIVAKDEELDKLSDLNKYILAYTVVDGKIEKYNYINVKGENTSGLLDALPLKEKKKNDLNIDNYNYTEPIKGQNAGTTLIEDLKGLEDFKADKWMYKTVDESTILPKRDTKVELSLDYEAGKYIEIALEEKILLMATDKDGRVRAAKVIEIIAEQIKNPLAGELKLTEDYNPPVKGNAIGHTVFPFIKMSRATKWVYVLSDTTISKPELDTEVTGGTPLNFETDKNSTVDIKIEDNIENLKSNDFKKYIMVYGLDGDDKIKVFKGFTINYENILMPNSGELISPGHYSEPVKGNSPNTTRINELKLPDGLGSGYKFRYKVVEDKIDDIEFNTIISGANNLTTTTNMATAVDKYLLIMVTDNDNRTKYCDVIKLEFKHVLAGPATPLQPTTNYVGPVPGEENATTRFTFLKPLSSSQEMYYTFVNKDFRSIESGTVIKIGSGTGEYTIAEKDVDISATIGDTLLLVSVDEASKKVVGARSFTLGEANIKGGLAEELIYDNYEFILGDNPSTTKLKLVPTGLENSRNIVWRYDLVDVKETDPNKLPYFNQVVNLPIYANQNGRDDAVIGRDIPVNKVGIDYGWILILATDSGGKVKAYDYVKIDSSKVKEHAPIIEKSGGGDLEYKDGITVDTIKFDDLPVPGDGQSYKYLISDREQDIPATHSTLPSGVKDYIPNSDIPVHIGKHLTLYKVDKDNKILAYKKLVVNKVMQGKAILPSDIFLEGDIKNGGQSFTIKLTGAKWADDLVTDKNKRDKLFNGFKADKETIEWNKVVSSMITDGDGSIFRDNDTEVTIVLPRTLSYDISEEMKVSLTVSAEAIEGALNPIVADETITIRPTIDATISGDVVQSIVRESDIKLGGKTIIITLKDGTWAADVTSIIDGFSEDGNWGLIKSAFGTGEAARKKYLTRNDGKMVTIVLPPVPVVNFGTTSETISLTIDQALVQGATEDIVASPNFTLYPDIVKVEGGVKSGSIVKVLPPDYRIIDSSSNTWTIENINGTLVSDLNNNHIVLNGLPKGLSYEVKAISDTSFNIEVKGTASAKVAENTIIKLKIKGSAISGPNSVDSDDIELSFAHVGAMNELNSVGIDVLNKQLTNTTANMMYSLDSTNGTTGSWNDAEDGKTDVEEFKAGKVYIKNKNNNNEYRLVKTLANIPKPTGIKIDEVSYGNNDKTMNIKLNIQDNLYQYRINESTWEDLDPNDFIKLDFSGTVPELRVRLKATKENLASLPSDKIDILYLGNVSKDVASGEIKNTTTNMQYSIDNGANYPTARSGNTTGINFIVSEVFIRDKNNPENVRSLGEVKLETQPTVTDIGYHIGNKEITYSGTGGTENLQYKIGDDPWKDVKDGKNIEFKVGELLFRTKATKDNLPSLPEKKADIVTSASAPELKVDDVNKKIEYRYNNEWKDITVADLKLQFRIGTGSWTDGTEWNPDAIKYENLSVQIRIKGTETELPSQFATVSFNKNLSLLNVELNVLEGYIENTSSEMQFSVNSTDGLNGTWNNCSNTRTTVEFKEKMIVYLRETKKPANNHRLNETGIKSQEEPDESKISHNILEGSITNAITDYIEYRFDNDKWTAIPMANSNNEATTVYNIGFKPGILEFRIRATKEKLPSPSISQPITAKASAPELTYNDINFTIANIKDTKDSVPLYEYSVNGGLWTDGTIDTQFEGGNKVKVRFKATEDKLPSQEQEITFTPSLYLGNVILNAGKLQLENTTTDMEYSFDNLDWFKCDKDITKINLKENMKVSIREIKKPKNQKPVNTEDTKKKNDTILRNNIGSITYDIAARTITIPDIIEDLQYRIGSGNWVNIDASKAEGVNFVAGQLEFRLKGNDVELPSDSILKATIQAQASAPNVEKGFYLDAEYKNNRNTVEYATGQLGKLEYSFYENGPWIDGSHLDSEILDKDVYIRTKADASILASMAKKLDFKPALNLKVVNLSTHVSPVELNGTTTQMEYMINDSGEWFGCSDGNTKLKRLDGSDLNDESLIKNIKVRDKNQPANFIIITP